MSTFDDLPHTLGRPSPPSSPRRRSKHWARRLERCCCHTFAYFPLLFVHGLTTWAIWVELGVSFYGTSILGGAGVWNYMKAALGVVLWGLANTSYSIAVFTSPGSPTEERRDAARVSRKGQGYEGLPTYEDEDQDGGEEQSVPHNMTMVTAKSTGRPRYCKKCHTIKPDRAHHCSTCGRCVLKMDHHCPWLATCVGLRNYKPFLLFLIYVSLFCWLCFSVSATWVWAEIIDDVQMDEGMWVVNTILLAVLGGIIGLVLSGFTGWHIYLAVTGQTTIESLEKTRYLAPLRKSMEAQPQRNYLDQQKGSGGEGEEQQSLTEHLKEIHANALPGVLRPEEGEEDSRNASRTTTPVPSHTVYNYTSSSGSPARQSLQRSYASLEAQRERDRYSAYLDEMDSEKLPNAFDLGWKRNLLHLFGDQPLLWFLPVCNTSGDGWQWDINPAWHEARDEVSRQRANREREEQAWSANGGEWADRSRAPAFEPPQARRELKWTPGQGFVNQARNAPPRMTSPANRQVADMQMQPLDRRKGQSSDEADSYDTSSDEEVKRMYAHEQIQGTGNWNDVPDDYLSPRRNGGVGRSRSRGRRKGD